MDTVKESVSTSMSQDSTNNILRVDDREEKSPHKLFAILIKLEANFIKEHLPIGDFVYNDYVFERKWITDLWGSIIDGRIFEQVENMKENFDHVYVVVSGQLKECINIPKFNPNVIFGAMASLLTKSGINVLWVENDTQLIKLILKICEKSTEPYVRHMKRIKMSKEDIYACMLAQIPRMGYKTAKLILDNSKIKIQLENLNEDELLAIKGIGKKKVSLLMEYF